MFKLKKVNLFKTLVLVGVFLFTFILRAHEYERTPGVGHLDEMLYAWSGLSLVETGIPVSWSTLDYPKSAEVFKGEINYKGSAPKSSVTLYKPWLDEPPLFSYLVGLSASHFGAKTMEFTPSSYTRYPMIFISGATSILVFLIANVVSGYWIGILSMLIYGTVPIFIFASRTAMPETFISFCFALLVYLVLLFNKKPLIWYIVPIPFLAGISGLSKPTGFFIILFALFFVFRKLFREKKVKKAIYHCLYLTLLTLPFIAFYFWWGYHFDWQIFQRINAIQSMRPVGFGSLAWYFITPSYDTIITRDSWFVFGTISAVYFLFRGLNKEKFIVLMAFVFWVLVVMISGGENDLLSWYRFPSYPFLAIILSWGLVYLVKRANVLTMFIAGGMLLGNRMLLVNPFHPNVTPSHYRLIISLLMIPPLLYLVFKKQIFKFITKGLIVGIIVAGMFFNVKYLYNSFEIACQSVSCPLVPSTFLSELRLPFVWRYLVMNMP